MKDTMAGKEPRLLAVEPAACPSRMRGRYAYDFGDGGGLLLDRSSLPPKASRLGPGLAKARD